MATRTLWKGAISFGLVHIPVGLHTASTSSGVDFDWLDKRTMDRVGYKRINKRTGKEIESENVVKGVEYEDGEYVIVSSEEIEAAYPRMTQTIEIQRFVGTDDIPFTYLERPYYLAPINKGQKVYALLREILKKTDKVGLAKVVIATKQHLAVLIPCGQALVLNLLRWGDEVKSLKDLDLPAAGVKAAGLSDAEMKMAGQLVDDMTGPWKPEDFHDEFKQAVMELVARKVEAGDTKTVVQPDQDAPAASGSSNVVDLTELLARSLRGGGKGSDEGGEASAVADASKKKAPAKKAPAKKPAATKPPAKKAPAKKAPTKKPVAKKSTPSRADMRKAA